MIEILYEDNHLLVVTKPINMPVCQDSSKDPDLLNELKTYLVNKYQKKNDAYLGMVHRLDRPVSGIMVFAKTSKAASRLSEQIRTNQFIKKYLTVVEGETLASATLTDKLLKDPKSNTVYVDPKGKESILTYTTRESINGLSLLEVTLITGRSHQIRVQLANSNHPLWGDQRYNKKAKVKQQIALYAYYLSFYHPISKELLTFTKTPTQIPFNLFNH